MSFKGIFQFILQIHDFTNLDIPYQGYFCLRASIYSKNSEKYKVSENYAIPFHLKTQQRQNVHNKRKVILQQKCEDCFFFTKTAALKFTDQKIVLNDIIRFKLQLQAFPSLNTDQIYLQFDLFFSNHHSSYTYQNEGFHGDIVQTKIFQLQNIQHGIFNFCEGQFRKTYISSFSFSLFGCLSNFQFGKYQITKKQAYVKEKDIKRNKIQNFPQLLTWSQKNYDKIDNAYLYFYKTYVKNIRYYFYLAQQKINKNSLIKKEIVLKVPKQFLQLEKIDEKMFRNYMLNYSPVKVTQTSLLSQINQICGDIFFFLLQIQKDFCLNQFMRNQMKKEYQLYKKDRYGERVFKSVVYGKNNALSSRQNKRIARKMRQKELISSGQVYPIDDFENFAKNQENMEFIFYEVTYPNKQKLDQKIIDKKQMEQLQIEQKKEHQKQVKKKQYIDTKIDLSDEEEDIHKQKQEEKEKQKQKKEQIQKQEEKKDKVYEEDDDQEKGDDKYELSPQHSADQQWFINKKSEETFQYSHLDYQEKNMLIVFCHGFQGSSYDMMIVYRYLKEILPDANFLISRSNEGQTEGSIEQMGQRVATQVRNFIRNYLDNDQVIINFIGHSMGGIIARASLKHLKKYEGNFGFYCSLSSPHLSYLNGVGGMIQAGLWFLRTFKTIQSLKELEMQEKKNPKQTYLYKLSLEGSLKKFRKVILWSSFEDNYVPWHSARIAFHHSKKESSLGKVENQMVQNILGNSPVHRVDVNFNIKTKNLDNFIGRTAHINLIVQDSLFKIVNQTIPKLFDIRES